MCRGVYAVHVCRAADIVGVVCMCGGVRVCRGVYAVHVCKVFVHRVCCAP